jgi:hypothetical protein
MASEPQEFLLFVDTNKFLDFYRARDEAGLKLLRRIETVSHLLIFTPQVEMEFLNNRQKVIWGAYDLIKVPNIQLPLPGYLSDSEAAKEIRTNARRIQKQVEALKQDFKGLLKDPAKNDPVFKIVEKVMATDSALNLSGASEEVQDEIYEAASKRFQRGHPPRKPDDNTMGDAINWEWILYCARKAANDVLIVSRDYDYGLSEDGGYMNDWLAREFAQATTKKAVLVPRLSDALKMLHINVTPAEQKEEESIIQEIMEGSSNLFPYTKFTRQPTLEDFMPQPPFPSYWNWVMERLGASHPVIAAQLSAAQSVKVQASTMTIWFPAQMSDRVDEMGRMKVGPKIEQLLEEMGRKFKVKFDSGFSQTQLFGLSKYAHDLGHF